MKIFSCEIFFLYSIYRRKGKGWLRLTTAIYGEAEDQTFNMYGFVQALELVFIQAIQFVLGLGVIVLE